MADDIALRSQQFAQQAANSTTPYDLAAIQSFGEGMGAIGQGLGRTFDRQQQQGQFDREMEMDEAMSAAELEESSLRRQQAYENLVWARELHTTDMMDLQKESQELAVEVQRMEVQKLRERDQAAAGKLWENLTTEDERDRAIVENDLFATFSNGKVVYRRPTEDEKKQPRARIALDEAREAEAHKAEMEWMQRRGRMRPTDLSREIQRQQAFIDSDGFTLDLTEDEQEREREFLSDLLSRRHGQESGGNGEDRKQGSAQARNKKIADNFITVMEGLVKELDANSEERAKK